MDENLETSLVQIFDAGEEEEQQLHCDEDFYEEIEAPKFVDFTAPEHRRPDDDCYWFCMRVGCDRKHEEEIDPEAIYKNFVLRVMASRSPNVRLRRALNRKALSTNVKCPQTAPPKSSRARASRFEVVSSISQKMAGCEVKGKSVTKLSATPNTKANRPVVGGKALTTPRNRKRVSNPHPFRSVRKPKAPDNVGLAKNKVVAKALFFHSPKKAVRIKASLELDTPMRKICSGMEKLEINSQRKPLEASRKKLGAREVKSRVFDSLRKGQEVKPPRRCAKGGDIKKKKVKQCDSSAPYEDDSSDMEIDEKSRNGSLDCKSNAGNVLKCLTFSETLKPLCENSAEAMPDKENGNEVVESDDKDPASVPDEKPEVIDADQENSNEILESDDKENASVPNEKPEVIDGDKENVNEVVESDDKENASTPDEKPEVMVGDDNKGNASTDDKENASTLDGKPEVMVGDDNKENASVASDDKENGNEAMESDDKENASVPDANREQGLNPGLAHKKFPGKQKNSKCFTQKVTQVLGKTIKDTNTSAANGTQALKYRKPKPTNPKPFRLRTDERRILKEANLEKRILLPPLKEITSTVPRFPGGISRRKQVVTHEGGEKESEKRTQKDQPVRKMVTCTPPHQNTSLVDLRATKSKDIVKKRIQSSTLAKQPARLQGVTPSRKEKPTHKTIETSRTKLKPEKSENDVVSARSLSRGKRPTIPKEPNFHSIHVLKPIEASITIQKPEKSENDVVSARSLSRGKRPTIPKEPNFHSIHVPKSCTKT